MIASFRFLFKSIAGYPYGRLLTNVGKALPRSFSGMARDGRALKLIPLTRCRMWRYGRWNPEPKAGFPIGSHILHLFGGSVKGASPLVLICPLHIKIKYN